jgi:hypothetical protein
VVVAVARDMAPAVVVELVVAVVVAVVVEVEVAVAGSVGTLDDGYVRNVPLLRAPRIQSASHVTCHGAIMRDRSTPLYSTLRVNSTPCHSTCVQSDPRIQNASHVPCHGAITRDRSTPLHSTPWVHSTSLHSTPLAYKQIHG